MKRFTSHSLILIGFIFIIFCTNRAVAQKNKSTDAQLSEKSKQTAQKAKREESLSAWLKSPYLNVPIEKATVNDLTNAFELWQRDNPRKASDNKVEFWDDEATKFQRKLYRWNRENNSDEQPASESAKLDAFIKYEKDNPPALLQNPNNPDANWKLLGPTIDPEEVPYLDPDRPGQQAINNIGLGRINCIEFSIWDTRNIWVGTSTGGVWKTWNGGQSWINISRSLPIMEISDVAIDQSNSNIIYVATGDRRLRETGGHYGNASVASRLFKTVDGGITWSEITADFGKGTYIEGLWSHPSRPHEVVVVKYSGVYKSVDGGSNWVKTIATDYAETNLIFMGTAYAQTTNPERIYNAYYRETEEGYTFEVQRSDDFGATWQLTGSVTTALNDPTFNWRFMRLAVAPSDANCLYIAASELNAGTNRGRFGALVRTLDGGNTWEDCGRYPQIPNILGSYFGDSTDLDSQDKYAFVLAVDPKDKERVYVHGIDMWGSGDGGKSFVKLTFWINYFGKSVHADHHWGEFQPQSGEYFLATDGGLFKTRQIVMSDPDQLNYCWNIDPNFDLTCYKLPTRWEFVGNGIANNEFYAIAVSKSNPNIVMGGTQDNGTLRRENGVWKAVYAGDGFVPLIHPTNPNIFYANAQNGNTAKTTDGGQTMRSILSDELRADPGDWLTPMEMVESNPDIVYAARQRNLWRTTDGGNTWRQISDFEVGRIYSEALALAVSQSHPNIILLSRRIRDTTVGLPIYQLNLTTDGGTTWRNIWNVNVFPTTRLTDIAFHPTQPNKIWLTFSAGYSATNVNQGRRVFYSENGGQSWANITEGLPPVPVWSVVAPENSATNAVYVATGFGVYYRDSNTKKFVEFQGGMPRGTMVTDLKIHDGVKKIYAGTHGKGMWVANLYDQPYEDNALSFKVKRDVFLEVYPNPNKGIFRIEWTEKQQEEQALDVVDMMGKTVFSMPQFRNRMTVDLSGQPSGIYFLRFKSGKEIVTKKLIVNK